MVTELSKALTRINDAVPRVHIELALYKTPWMQTAVSRFYAHVLLFLQKAVEWYNKGSFRRAVGSIFRPYPLTFEDTVTSIRACTDTIDKIANTSSHAEIRGLTMLVKAQDKTLHDVRAEMIKAQARHDAQISQVLQLATSEPFFTLYLLWFANYRRSLCPVAHHQGRYW